MKVLLGPELFWLLLYGGALVIARLNTPPVKHIEDLIQTLWFWIPAVSLLVFGLWWIPATVRSWLLLRVWAAGIIGGHFVIERALRASGTQNPGTGMGYLVGMLLELFVLVAGSVAVALLR